jgi:hypothetical protein
MPGYRNSCRGRRAWKANYFLIWGVEEHMIPCLHFLPSNLFCLYFFCEWNTLENWIRFGRCSATSWNPLKHIRRGWRALRCSRTVPLGFTFLPNIWRTPRYLQLHRLLYFLMRLVPVQTDWPHIIFCYRSRWCRWTHFLSLELTYRGP